MAVLLHETEGVTRVTLSRPPVNALWHDEIRSLRSIFESLCEKPPRAGVVLTGSGASFCGGIDVKAFASASDADRREFLAEITPMTAALLALPVPLVAAVNGHALGGGFVLVLSADLRIVGAAPDARFALTEARAGVPFPPGPLAIIRSEIEPSRLRWLTLTSEAVPATSLENWGLVDELVNPRNLEERASHMARHLAEQPAYGAIKEQVRGPLLDRVRSAGA